MSMGAEIVRIYEAGDYHQQISRAVARLQEGGIVVLPTETVYGAAGLLANDKAQARLKDIRAASGSKDNKPFTIHLAHREQAMRYLGEVGEVGIRLMKKLWPGPVGLMFEVPADRRGAVAKEVGVDESAIYVDGTVTLRCPDHIVATDVLSEIDAPIVVTAAGSSAAALQDKVDVILDTGPTRFNKPSTLLRVKPKGYEIVRAGVYDERIIERMLKTTILFVCSGNTCRSPMAESLARVTMAKKLGVAPDDLESKGVTIVSAGAFAMPGTRAAAQAVEAVRPLGADLTKHRSRPLSVELIHQADVIFTMSRSHSAAVTALVPSAAEKTMTLDPKGDIDDPIGGDLELYQKLAVEIQRLLEQQLDEKVKI